MSKRRKGYPSETQVKRGGRVVHGEKELTEKLGRNDLCPCGSGKRFKKCCLASGCFRRREPRLLLSENDTNDSRRCVSDARRDHLPCECGGRTARFERARRGSIPRRGAREMTNVEIRMSKE